MRAAQSFRGSSLPLLSLVVDDWIHHIDVRVHHGPIDHAIVRFVAPRGKDKPRGSNISTNRGAHGDGDLMSILACFRHQRAS